MSKTTFTTLYKEVVDDAEWPNNYTLTGTLIEGELAEAICRKAGLEGLEDSVILHEEGRDGGYSEFTQEWEVSARIEVDTTIVWDWEYFSSYDSDLDRVYDDHLIGRPNLKPERYRYSDSPIDALFKWLYEKGDKQ